MTGMPRIGYDLWMKTWYVLLYVSLFVFFFCTIFAGVERYHDLEGL